MNCCFNSSVVSFSRVQRNVTFFFSSVSSISRPLFPFFIPQTVSSYCFISNYYHPCAYFFFLGNSPHFHADPASIPSDVKWGNFIAPEHHIKTKAFGVCKKTNSKQHNNCLFRLVCLFVCFFFLVCLFVEYEKKIICLFFFFLM